VAKGFLKVTFKSRDLKKDAKETACKEQSRNIPETEVTCAEAQSNKALITFKNETDNKKQFLKTPLTRN